MSQSLLNQISEHVHWLPPDETTDRPILGAITGQHGTVVIDAGNSPAHAQRLLNGLAELNLPQPTFLVLTHWHWDHVFGTAAFDCPIIAYRETKRIVEEMAHLDWSDEALDQRVEVGVEIEFCRDMIKAEWPDHTQLKLKPPDIAFADELELDLGDVTCQIIHVGGDHADDSSIVYVPEDNIIFLGDCLYQDLYYRQPNYTAKKLFPLVDRLLSYDADYYLLAHNSEPMSNAALVEFTTLLKTIGQTVQQVGDQRALNLQALTETIGTLNDEHLELVDAFLVGLGKSVSGSGA